MCETWCNIAYVHEKAGHDYEEIRGSYLKALEFAGLSGRQQAAVGIPILEIKTRFTNTFLLKMYCNYCLLNNNFLLA